MKSIPPAPAMNCESEYQESSGKEENIFLTKRSLEVARTYSDDQKGFDVAKILAE
jgi:hypothetical protein